MKKIFFVLLCTSLSSSVWAQYNPLTLGIVIPEQDTVEYPFSRYRVAAHTDPDAQAFINGKQVQVYRSGAFVDMVFPLNRSPLLSLWLYWMAIQSNKLGTL